VHEKLIVFDLGGVLASLGRPAEQMGLDGSDQEFWSIWLGSKTVAAFETGAMEEAEFVERFPAELGLADSGEDFRRRLTRWRLELFPGASEMLSRLGETHSVALLSNTNAIHWNMVNPDGRFRRLFDHVFLSFEIGLAKPHRDIFAHVIQTVPYTASDTVFLDDTASNVEAAATFGIQSKRVAGIDESRRALGLGE
jgi:putative hydrolase of the HAD superfamily